MSGPQPTPCGAWTSPITTDLIVKGSVGLGGVQLDGETIYWLEHRPQEQGRYTLIRRAPDGTVDELTPAPRNVRTRVHEYGGGAYAVGEGEVIYADFADQRWYWHKADGEPKPVSDAGFRYADGVVDRMRGRLVAVQEDHTDDFEPPARVVSLDIEEGTPYHVLADGSDFYASPRLSDDRSRLAYVCWNHPHMPWDESELWVLHFEDFGAPGIKERIAGDGESVCHPLWAHDNTLYFISDRGGWWNIYRWARGEAEPVCPREADFARPHWVFGDAPYAFAGPDRIVCSWTEGGRGRLGLLDVRSKNLDPFDLPYTHFSSVCATPTHAVFAAGSPTEEGAIVRLDLATGEPEVLRRASQTPLDPKYVSVPRAIEFPTEPLEDGTPQTAHALYYPPTNPDHTVPEGEKPPLLVLSHGGPTSAAPSALRLGIQYWTSRGFALVDVNYRGSSGYGRAYRQALEGNWGVADMQDCAKAAAWLVEQGEADPNRLAIRGGSAGGYTTLCALTFLDVFHAGASHFGVSDLEALARDTHKFESRYLDRLIGPYPERRDLYEARSPIHHVEGLSCPVILLQGLEDAVVPPNQAETMVAALKEKGIPVAYVPFEGEQHGFRKAENIQRALEAELYFYGKVFGFTPAEEIEPVPIENLPA